MDNDNRNTPDTGAPASDTTSALFVSARKKQLEQQEEERKAREKEAERLAAEAEVRRLEQEVAERKRQAEEESKRVAEETRRIAEDARLKREQAAADPDAILGPAQKSAPRFSPPQIKLPKKEPDHAAPGGDTQARPALGKKQMMFIGIGAGALVVIVLVIVLIVNLTGGKAPAPTQAAVSPPAASDAAATATAPASASAAADSAPPAAANAAMFTVTLTNRTGYLIEEVYVSNTGDDSWGNDHLDSSSVLKNNGSFEIKLQKFDFESYDIRIIDTDGDISEYVRVPMKEGSTIALSYGDPPTAEVTHADGATASIAGKFR